MFASSQDTITSPRNHWIKLARSLHRRRIRYRERAILVEGVRPIAECIGSGCTVRALLVSDSVDESSAEIGGILSQAEAAEIPIYLVADALLRTAADTETPQGLLAIAEMPRTTIPQSVGPTPLILIADSVRDPGNLGTLLRSALGTGVDLVLVGPGCVDPFAPKVLRAGAGSHFRLQIAFLDWSEVPDLLSRCRVYLTQADAELDYVSVQWNEAVAIVVGNETQGVSEAAIPHADGRVGIPLANSLESLNAGIAGSVILFEAWRQRRSV
jgi:RNA methyltransferase, TrmH family